MSTIREAFATAANKYPGCVGININIALLHEFLVSAAGKHMSVKLRIIEVERSPERFIKAQLESMRGLFLQTSARSVPLAVGLSDASENL